MKNYSKLITAPSGFKTLKKAYKLKKVFKKIIKKNVFWKSVFFLGILFALIYDVIDLGFRFRFDFSTYAQMYFSSPYRVFRFLVANILGGFLYGFIITFFKFRRKIKELEGK